MAINYPGAVLLIEDDPNDVILLQLAFRKVAPDFRLEVLRDGDEAVKYLTSYLSRNSAPLPAIILTDLKMPKLNGHELIEWIRRQDALTDIPVVVLSSSNMQADTEQAMKLGANACYQKPQSREALSEIIRAILRLA